MRFKVDIDQHSLQLFKWSDYAKMNKINKKWYKTLDKVGGGLSHTWWLYIGEIDIRSSQVEISIKENNVFIPKLTDHILKIYAPHPAWIETHTASIQKVSNNEDIKKIYIHLWANYSV